MTKDSFKKIVDSYIRKNYRSRSECSRHYGCHSNYIYRCFNDERPFPDKLVKDLGFRRKTTTVETFERVDND